MSTRAPLALSRPAPSTAKAPTRAFMERLEAGAKQIRARAGVGQTGRFNPFASLGPLRLVVMRPTEIEALTGEQLARIHALDAKTWSGMARGMPDGQTLVLLNPNQTQERMNVTLLEEAAHVHYGHTPTEIAVGPSGLPERTFDPGVEQQAYWTAGAALLPALDVAKAVYTGRLAETIGAAYGASRELVEMRIKTLGLWRPYQRNLSFRATD